MITKRLLSDFSSVVRNFAIKLRNAAKMACLNQALCAEHLSNSLRDARAMKPELCRVLMQLPGMPSAILSGTLSEVSNNSWMLSCAAGDVAMGDDGVGPSFAGERRRAALRSAAAALTLSMAACRFARHCTERRIEAKGVTPMPAPTAMIVSNCQTFGAHNSMQACGGYQPQYLTPPISF